MAVEEAMGRHGRMGSPIGVGSHWENLPFVVNRVEVFNDGLGMSMKKI